MDTANNFREAVQQARPELTLHLMARILREEMSEAEVKVLVEFLG